MKFDMKDVLKAILLSMVLLMLVFCTQLPAGADCSGLTGPVTGDSLVLWLDAQDINGEGNSSEGPAKGVVIDHWADKSTRGNHAVQPVAERRPCRVAAGTKGRFCSVRFTASKKQYLHVEDQSCLDLSQLTAFVVAKVNARSASMWLFGKNHFSGPWTGYGIAVEGASVFPWPHLGLGKRNPRENGYVKVTTNIREAFALVELSYDGRRISSAVNGRRLSRALSGSIQKNDRGLLIGAGAQFTPATEFLDGDIAELLLYNRALKPAEQKQTRQYLLDKYALKLTEAEDPGKMVVIDNGYLPVIIENPVTPRTSTPTPDEADAVLRRDWLFQAGDRPTIARAEQEIRWARELGNRLKGSDFSVELAELDALEKQLAAPAGIAGDIQTARSLYLAVRRVKRGIAFKNPAVDFTQLLLIDQPYPAGSPEWRHEAVHRLGYRAVPGGRLLVLDGLHPGGRVRQLFPPKPGSFWRPDISFDGKTALFCFKPHDEKSFHLYEINIDGTGLRQLTDSDYDDIDPIYLPDGHIIFTSTRANTYVRCGPFIYSYVLARCDADGRNVYLISRNSEPDFVPALLNDGRVIYSRWEYSDKDQNRVQSLWATNQDGTGTVAVWGNQSVWPDHLAEPRPIPGSGRVMFTGVGHHNWFIGSIGIVDPKRGSNFPHGLTQVTSDLPWAEVGNPPGTVRESPRYHASGGYKGYLGAYPLSNEDFIVSAKGRKDKFRVYLMDVYGNRELIYEGFYNAWYAMPVKARPRPPRQPDTVAWPGTGKDRQPTEPGLFYNPNIYQGVPELTQGSVKYLRVFQQDSTPYSTWHKTFAFSGPPISAVQSEAVKRIVSIVPVETDGSVYFEAPAGKALFFQLLDEHYRALHTMRSFTGVMPGESRGCVGCHETQSVAPPGKSSLSLKRTPTKLSPPPWGTESIGYHRFVQPVLDRYCGQCHQGDGKARKDFDLTVRPAPGVFKKHFTQPYLTLIGPAAWPEPAPNPGQPGFGLAGAFPVYGLQPDETYPNDPATDRSSTIWRTLRPMRYLSFRSRLIEMAGNGKHYKVKVDPISLRRLIAWVDANCPYLGEEEIRAMDDPKFPGIEQLPVRPRLKTAPVIQRP